MRTEPSSLARIAAFTVALTVALMGLQASSTPPAVAADSSEFDPGMLITDAAFFNGSAMTAAQVDAFIDDRNPGCLITVCLTNYKENVKAKAKTSRCAAIPAKSNQSAGQIIATVAVACGISPRAILVILQKEQSLVTNRTPSSHAFQASMGAGCPDTAPCDGKYAGFYENVYYGASLLKGYTIPGSTHYNRYPAGKTTSIAYSPKTYSSGACGYKSVYVQNQATHALYVYTPYTPNKAALTNLYGTGDSCSAYGNRNFWRLYVDWFGPTGAYAETAITEFWNAKGGATGTIGQATGAAVKSTAADGGYYRPFSNGTISWTEAYGAKYLTKTFSTAWFNTGIATAGWPQQSTYTSTTAGGGNLQKTTKGMLVKRSGKSTFFVTSGFRNAWETYGGPGGVLGWPHAAKYSIRSGVWAMDFDNGVVFHDTVQFAWVGDRFADEYVALGELRSPLGWPTGNYTADTMRGGVGWQTFEEGKLFESQEYGTFAVTGALYDAYAKLGGRAAIGWPTSAQYTAQDGKTVVQDFEDASIVSNGAQHFVVATSLVEPALERGLFGGKLGAPLSEPKWSDANGGGVTQDFVGGTLAKGPTGDVTFVYGGLLTAWDAKGRESGVLGWPIGDRYNDTVLNTVNQDFQYGTVFHNRVKWGTVGSNFVAKARELGVTTSALGWATSNAVNYSKNGGGQYQSFTKGTITWQSTTGAIFVPKAIWNARMLGGGIGGALGWPQSAATTKSGVTTQKFAGGTITWSAASGAKFTPNK